MKRVQVKLVKSPWGRLPKHRACLVGLGLRRVGSTRELEDTPAVRGMIAKVDYLLDVQPVAPEGQGTRVDVALERLKAERGP